MSPILVPGGRVCRGFIRFASFRRACAPKRKPDCVLLQLLALEQASQPTSFTALVNSEMRRNSHLHTGFSPRYRYHVTTSTHGASSSNVENVAINIIRMMWPSTLSSTLPVITFSSILYYKKVHMGASARNVDHVAINQRFMSRLTIC